MAGNVEAAAIAAKALDHVASGCGADELEELVVAYRTSLEEIPALSDNGSEHVPEGPTLVR